MRKKFYMAATVIMVVGIVLAFGCAPASAPAPATTAPAALSPELESLRLAMGIPTGAAAGQGLKLQLGGALPLSGGAEVYGERQQKGAELAIKDIKAMGGPEFVTTWYDIEMGVSERGVEAIRQMAAKHTGMALVGWCACAAAEVPGAQENKILLLDGGGGVGFVPWMGLDYFWGTRAIKNRDHLDGALEYIIRTHPEWKTVMSMGQTYGADLDKDTVKWIQTVTENKGLVYLGDERVAFNAEDFTDVIPKIKTKNPDVLFLLPMDGPAAVFFMKQFVRSGLKAKCIDGDYTEDQAKLAGSDFKDMWYAGQAFFTDRAVSPFSRHFVKAYEAEYNMKPDEFAGNFYEDAFALWDLIRRVIANGGDPASGEQLQNALKANPTFASVYGGDENTAGTYTLDLKQHTPISIPLYLCAFNEDGTLDPLAEYSVVDPLAPYVPGGKDFKIIK
jgi:branched-chain amino acid transport system substrate-binding protein